MGGDPSSRFWARGGYTNNWRATVPILFVFVLAVLPCSFKTSHLASRPHFLQTATLHSHILSAHTAPPHSHLYFGYKLPVRHVPLGLASVFVKDRATLHVHSTHSIKPTHPQIPHALTKYTKEPCLYPPSPLTNKCSSVGHAQAPHRLTSRWYPSFIHSSNSLAGNVAIYV